MRDGPTWARFFETFVSRVAQVPGVDAAGAASAIPLTGTAEGGGFVIVGREPASREDTPRTAYVVTQGAYFRAAGIALREGRPFDDTDRANARPVAIISRSLAERYFPGQDALGQQVRATFEFSETPAPRTIVGIVDDVKHWSLDGETMPTIYVPEQQLSYPVLSLVVRSSQPMDALLPAIRRELRAAHPMATLAEVRPLSDVMRQSLARQG
jgi:hypothetical protein